MPRWRSWFGQFCPRSTIARGVGRAILLARPRLRRTLEPNTCAWRWSGRSRLGAGAEHVTTQGSAGPFGSSCPARHHGGAARSPTVSRRTGCSAVCRVFDADADNLEVVLEPRAGVLGTEGREPRNALVVA